MCIKKLVGNDANLCPKGSQHVSLYKMLVGGLNPSEKYEFVNWDDYIPN